MAAHKHAEWIKAKADGYAIQYQFGQGAVWNDMAEDDWEFPISIGFRVKPAAPVVEYPVTRMTTGQISSAWTGPAGVLVADLVEVANAAIRHAIDAQQVVRMAEVQEIASQLGKDKRAARDMAVAEAVHQAHVQGRYSIPGAWDLDLSAVIASVK